MNKSVKNSIIVILIVIIIFIISWIGYDIYKAEPANANVEHSNLADENTGLDNIINVLLENVEIKEEIENKVEEPENIIKEENDEIEKENESYEGSVTSREEKAVKLVKQAWGEDDSVYFSYQSVDNQGRYIVSVNRKDTTVLAFFLVDVDNEVVTKQ